MRLSLLYRPVWLPATVMTALLLATLSLLVMEAWRSLQRLDPLQAHIVQLQRIQETGLKLQEIVLASLAGRSIDPKRFSPLRAEITEIVAMGNHLVPQTPSRLREVRSLLLDGIARNPQAGLTTVLDLMQTVVSSETRAHQQLVGQIRQDTANELRLATYTVIAFPVLGMLVLFSLRKRILMPLNDLRSLMSLLARQDYSTADTSRVDPLLRPLFANYNQLVERLAELEREHRARQRSLEEEVGAATRALLEQQSSLARAERLAAVGEVAAGLAHELRNPLAGMQMALGNLRSDLAEVEQQERLDLVVTEIKRLTRLLNEVLTQARQAPEQARSIDVSRLIGELLVLLRYQVPERVRLVSQVPGELRCFLPEGALRQALLNLVLNASQTLEKTLGEKTLEGRMPAPSS